MSSSMPAGWQGRVVTVVGMVVEGQAPQGRGMMRKGTSATKAGRARWRRAWAWQSKSGLGLSATGCRWPMRDLGRSGVELSWWDGPMG